MTQTMIAFEFGISIETVTTTSTSFIPTPGYAAR